jgi:hypothetical protein
VSGIERRAAISAAAASQSSHAQFGCSSVQRRRSNSAMVAYFMASEAALARAQPATVSINAASSRPRSVATSAGSDSNMYSIIEPTADTFVHQFQADGYSKIGRHNPSLEC